MGFLKNSFFLSATVMGEIRKAIPSGSIFIACHCRKQISEAENSDIQSFGPISSGMCVQGSDLMARTKSLEMVFPWEVLSSYLPLKKWGRSFEMAPCRRLSYGGWRILPGFVDSRGVDHLASPLFLLSKRIWTRGGSRSVKASTVSI